MKIWAFHIYQVLIPNKLVINKSKKNVYLLVLYSLLPLDKLVWFGNDKLKSLGYLCKKSIKKNPIAKINKKILTNDISIKKKGV